MKFEYKPRGVCSDYITFEVDGGIVRNVQITGGCNGNSQGIAALVEGMEIDEVIRRTNGIHCGRKDTSCPDQLSLALMAAKKKLASGKMA